MLAIGTRVIRSHVATARADRGMSARVSHATIGGTKPSADHVIQVSENRSKRWDLALERLDRGGATTVVDGDPPTGLQRWVGRPGVDGRIHVSIYTELEPKSLTPEIASRDVAAGLRTLAEAVTADPRLAALLQRHGVVREYVYDNGAVTVGDVDA